MVTLYLDWDGTIVEVRTRHYRVYADMLAYLGQEPLSPTLYWTRMRRGASALGLTSTLQETDRAMFHREWLARIESPQYLSLDALIPGAKPSLAALAERHDLVLVTLRRDRAALTQQISSLGLIDLFSAIYCHSGLDDSQSKADLIRIATPDVNRRSIVVGDSEADVQSAREVFLASVCVTTGVRNRRYLTALQPDHLIPAVSHLGGLLQSLGL